MALSFIPVPSSQVVPLPLHEGASDAKMPVHGLVMQAVKESGAEPPPAIQRCAA